MRARKRIILPLVSGLLIAGAAGAGEIQDLPRSLRGRVSIEIAWCRPYAGTGYLMEAEIRIRTGAAEVALPDLQCGAFRPGTDRPLFLNPVDGVRRVPAETRRVVRAVFPFDRQHTECRCVVGGVRRIDRGQPWREEPSAEPRATPRERAAPEPGRAPSSARVLRRELVLPPAVEVRSGPGLEHEVVGQVGASQLIEVLGLQGGWKWIRVPGRGVEGWIPDDATTPDLQAPGRLAGVLDRLHPHLEPGGTRSDRTGELCQAISLAELTDLLFALRPETRSAYVTKLWYALSEPRQGALQIYLNECFGVTRIVDMTSGDELRNLDWGDEPPLASGETVNNLPGPDG